MDNLSNSTPVAVNHATILLPEPVNVAALETLYADLTAREAETFEASNTPEILVCPTTPDEWAKVDAWAAAREARNAFLGRLALTPSSDPEVIRAKAQIWANMQRDLDDTLSFPIEAAVEPDDDGIVHLDDALARSIARDVVAQVAE